jgi:hypothetical protein
MYGQLSANASADVPRLSSTVGVPGSVDQSFGRYPNDGDGTRW